MVLLTALCPDTEWSAEIEKPLNTGARYLKAARD